MRLGLDVVIIGAGLSGLTSAAVLRKTGINALLIDAAPRIGGRIQSLREPETNQSLVDLGPTWVWPKHQPVVAKWLNALGLKTFDQFNEGDAVIQGYAPEPFLQPLPGQDGMVRVVGGPAAFIDAFSAQIDPGCICTAAPVLGVFEGGPQQVEVHLKSGDVIRTRHVILSIPLRVAASNLDMPWAAPALLEAMRATPTWMSTHAKAVAIYEKPFWRDAGLAGRLASRTGPLVEAHDHCGPDGAPAAIFGFVGWPPEVRQKDPKGLEQAIIDQLVACFGPSAAHPLKLVVQDWATHSNIVAKTDLSSPPHHPDVGPAILRQAHLDGLVRFSVSEVSEVSPGLIEGALAAGQKAAEQVLADLV